MMTFISESLFFLHNNTKMVIQVWHQFGHFLFFFLLKNARSALLSII